MGKKQANFPKRKKTVKTPKTGHAKQKGEGIKVAVKLE